MEITGFIAVGNGEPCPYCGKPFEKADDVFKHMEVEHKEQMLKDLGQG